MIGIRRYLLPSLVFVIACALVTAGGALASQSSEVLVPPHGEDTLDLLGAEATPPQRLPGGANAENLLTYVSSTFWSSAFDVAIKDTIIFVLTINGLQVFSIADNADPVLLGEYHIPYLSAYNNLFLDNNRLFVGTLDYLCIFDVSNPLQPALLSETELEGIVYQIEVVGNRAYVGVARTEHETMGNAGFFILDVTDPSQPHTIGKFRSSTAHQDCRRFTIVGDYVYAANDWEDRIEIIDLSDETRPLGVGYIPTKYPIDVAYLNGYLYVDKYYDTLCVYDLTNPVTPQLLASHSVYWTVSLRRHDGILFAVCNRNQSNGDSLRVFSAPTPEQLTQIEVVGLRAAPWTVTLAGTGLIVPEGTDGFTIFDITDPADITKTAVYSYTLFQFTGMALNGNLVYISNSGAAAEQYVYYGISIINVSDRQNPELVNWIYCGGSKSLLVSGEHLFTCGAPRTFIYSLSDPVNPVMISEFPNSIGYTTHNAISGTTLYVSWGPYSPDYNTVDVSNPNSPLLLDNVSVPNFYPYGTLIHDNLAYVCGRDPNYGTGTHLITFDVSDPSHILAVDDLTIGTCSWSYPDVMIEKGSYIYLANQSCGIATIDIRTLTQPDLAMTTETLGEYCYDFAIKRNYLIAACRSSLQVYTLDDPGNPVFLQYVPLAASPLRIAVDGDYVYVSSRWGFYVYQLNLPPIACGDANADGLVDISDVVYLISYIFSGGSAPDPLDAGDANNDAIVDISDAVYLIAYIFSGGQAPCQG